MESFEDIRRQAEKGLTGPQIEIGHSYLKAEKFFNREGFSER